MYKSLLHLERRIFMDNNISVGLTVKPVQTTYRGKNVLGAANEVSEIKNADSFEKSVDNYIKENRRRQKQEQKLAEQQRRDIAASRRRKMKLLQKKHEDYLRFLQGTALKRSLAERERIKNPNISEAEVDYATDLAQDTKAPLFIRIR